MWRARAFVACVVYSVISIVLHAYVVSVLSLHLLFFFFFLRLLFYSFFFFCFSFVLFRFVSFFSHSRWTKREEETKTITGEITHDEKRVIPNSFSLSLFQSF